MSRRRCKHCLAYRPEDGECWVSGNTVDADTPACIDYRKK